MKLILSNLLLLAAIGGMSQTPEKDAHLGLWELVVWTATNEEGEVAYPYGKDAIGRVHYLENGQMTFTLTANERPKFGTYDHTSIDPQLVIDAFDNYFTYFGTYTIDEEKGIVTHHIEGCLFPDWVGEKQERYFEFEGENLILKAYNKFGRDHELIWQKVGD